MTEDDFQDILPPLSSLSASFLLIFFNLTSLKYKVEQGKKNQIAGFPTLYLTSEPAQRL